MAGEQQIVRWVLIAPSLVLMVLYLPMKGGGVHFAGICDLAFLASGTLDIFRLSVELLILAMLGCTLDYIVKDLTLRS